MQQIANLYYVYSVEWVRLPHPPPIMRDWYSGIMTAFQADETGSIPVSRSINYKRNYIWHRQKLMK